MLMAPTWAEPRQWDVWWADLGNGEGSEATGRHPVVVVGSTKVFAQLGVIPVVAGTTTSRSAPTVVEIRPVETGLTSTTYLEVHQLRSLAKSPKRFVERVGSLGFEARARVAVALQFALPGVWEADDASSPR